MAWPLTCRDAEYLAEQLHSDHLVSLTATYFTAQSTSATRSEDDWLSSLHMVSSFCFDQPTTSMWFSRSTRRISKPADHQLKRVTKMGYLAEQLPHGFLVPLVLAPAQDQRVALLVHSPPCPYTGLIHLQHHLQGTIVPRSCMFTQRDGCLPVSQQARGQQHWIANLWRMNRQPPSCPYTGFAHLQNTCRRNV